MVNTDEDADGNKLIRNYNSKEGTELLGKEIKGGNLSTKVRSILKDVYSGKSVKSQIFHPYYKEQVMLVGVPYGKQDGAHGAILLAEPLSGFDSFLRDIYIYTSIVGVLALILSFYGQEIITFYYQAFDINERQCSCYSFRRLYT